MPISKEDITKNEALANLEEAQISAIINLSTNTEQASIDEAVERIHSQYDEDVVKITGKAKPHGEKSYTHLQNVLTDLVEKGNAAAGSEELKNQFNALKEQKEALEKKIAAGVTDSTAKTRITELEQQVADKAGELETLRKTFETEKGELQTKLEAQVAANTTFALGKEFDEYKREQNLVFKSSLPVELVNETIAARETALLNEVKVDEIDDGKGGKMRVFRGKDGQILRNPNNAQNPYSYGELLHSRIKDLVDVTGKGGAGTTGGNGKPSGLVSISGAKTQVEADELIVNHILTVEGIPKTDARFAERQSALRNDHKVADLPIR